MATHTHPSQWDDTDPSVIATMLDVLDRQARGRRG